VTTFSLLGGLMGAIYIEPEKPTMPTTRWRSSSAPDPSRHLDTFESASMSRSSMV
jgi:hypothetical protein